MSAASFTDYASRLRANDPDLFLGQLVWYSVYDEAKIAHTDLTKLLVDCGLDAYTPRAPKDLDVFRRVCTDAQRKRVPTTNPEVFENYLIRDVQRANSNVCKQVVREQVDANNRRLAYEPMVEVCFHNLGSAVTSKIVSVNTSADEQMVALQIADEIAVNFQAARGTCNGYAIRELIRRVLVSSAGTLVRPGGGVYFIMRQHIANVAALERLASKINGTSVHALPLLDDAKQRKMIKEAFENETVGEVDKALVEIDKLLAGPEITETKFQNILADMKGLVDKTEEFSDLLEEQMGNADFRIKMYKSKMRALLDHVVADPS